MKWLLAAAALTGCGGGVDEKLGGTWFGTSVGVIGSDATTYSSVVVVTLTETGAVFSPACVGTQGALELQGSGDSLAWSGTYSCPPESFTECANVVITFKSATASLKDNALRLHAEGVASGCNLSFPAHLDFNGGR